MQRTYHADNTYPKLGWIFVFAANAAGKHNVGKAKTARKNFHAQFGVSEGRTGDAYAITTRCKADKCLPLEEVAKSIKAFLSFANKNPKLMFFVSRFSGAESGQSDAEIAGLFKQAPANCSLPEEWQATIEEQSPQPRKPKAVAKELVAA